MDEIKRLKLINTVNKVKDSHINNINHIRDCINGAASSVIEKRVELLEKKENENYTFTNFLTDTLLFCLLAATSEVLIGIGVAATLNSIIRFRGITIKAIKQKSIKPFKKIEPSMLFSLKTKDLKLKNTVVYDILNKGLSDFVEKSISSSPAKEEKELNLPPASGMKFKVNNWASKQENFIKTSSSELIDLILDLPDIEAEYEDVNKTIKQIEAVPFTEPEIEDLRTYFEIVIWLALYPIYKLAGSENPPLFEGYNSFGLENDIWSENNGVYSIPLSSEVKKEFDKLAAKGKLIRITIFNQKIWEVLKEKIDEVKSRESKPDAPKVEKSNPFNTLYNPQSQAENILNTKEKPYFDFLNNINTNLSELSGKIGVYYSVGK